MSKALIVVDVQNDFCTGGALGIPGGEAVAQRINKIMHQFDKVVLTQDWHPPGHISFETWPIHCVQGSKGAEFERTLYTNKANLILRKGTKRDVDSYSGFVEDDNSNTGLTGYLEDNQIHDVYVCGLALDYCVAWTALDAAEKGFHVFVIIDLCRGLHPATILEMGVKMASRGITTILSTDIK